MVRVMVMVHSNKYISENKGTTVVSINLEYLKIL